MAAVLNEILGTLRVVSLPLVTRFRGVDARELAVFEGPQGWSEFSPFLEYDDAESANWLRAAIEFGYQPSPSSHREQIWVNATVPAVPAEAVPGILARFDGCRTAKVKVAEPGQTLADDAARVRAVRDALGPEGRIRIDANGAWNLDEAEHAVHALAEFDLEYLEQPCAHVHELVELRRRIRYLDIPIAVDEGVRKAADPLAAARAGAADILIVKAQPVGGIASALQLAAASGLPVVVSSALESSIGLSLGASLAAALPTLDYDCGLGTASLLAADVCGAPLRPRAGMLDVGPVTPDPALLARYAVSAERERWWRERVRRCYGLL